MKKELGASCDNIKRIFDFIYECKGAITFNDVYSMPVSIRNFYISRLIYKLNEKAEAINKAKRKH